MTEGSAGHHDERDCSFPLANTEAIGFLSAAVAATVTATATAIVAADCSNNLAIFRKIRVITIRRAPRDCSPYTLINANLITPGIASDLHDLLSINKKKKKKRAEQNEKSYCIAYSVYRVCCIKLLREKSNQSTVSRYIYIVFDKSK